MNHGDAGKCVSAASAMQFDEGLLVLYSSVCCGWSRSVLMCVCVSISLICILIVALLCLGD